jgi:hypothetical protein
VVLPIFLLKLFAAVVVMDEMQLLWDETQLLGGT